MNLQLLKYVIRYIERHAFKNTFLFIVLTLITWLLASIFFITNSMKYELSLGVDALPDIVLQNTKGGMRSTVDERVSEHILEIPGVKSVKGRVWGYYYFDAESLYLSLVGVDIFEPQERDSLVRLVNENEVPVNSMFVGEGVKALLARNYYSDYFNFIKSDGTKKRINIAGTFTSAISLESNEMMVMPKNELRDIFGYTEHEATDIAIDVANKTETPMLALKLQQEFPNMRVVVKDDVKVFYENIFNYKNGLFLALFTIVLFTFFVIVYDKLSAISSADKREIGILKAIGWRVEDILKAKLYEALLISFNAFLLGLVLALAFVYFFDAPIIQDIFIGYTTLKPSFELIFVLDIDTLFLLFVLIVPVYTLATLIPAWRIAIVDADEVIR
ncbi:MAG: FtsX-like permease family protein [Campylobacterales bacterium]|nr:FtsX-like permease family protein [Campylobacterales bacterium]